MRRHRRRRVVAVLTSAILLVFTAITARVFVWPDLPPPPAHADAIIELGGPGDRDAVTLALAAEHRAPVVIQSTVPGDDLSDTCLPPVEGVRVRCFHPVPDSTRGEARWIGEQAAEHGWHTVIIVTTPDHAWRARLRIQRCFPGEVYVVTSPLPPLDWFRQIPYQWAASAKAMFFQRGC